MTTLFTNVTALLMDEGFTTLRNGFVAVDRNMAASLPGVFAAGDCTGKPFQVSKAVGEGLIAGQSASSFLERL